MFWRLMEFHQWAHPYNDKGERFGFSAIPKQLERLKDYPCRSLAAEARKAGGYAKEAAPYTEFLGPISFACCFAKEICAAVAVGAGFSASSANEVAGPRQGQSARAAAARADAGAQPRLLFSLERGRCRAGLDRRFSPGARRCHAACVFEIDMLALLQLVGQ